MDDPKGEVRVLIISGSMGAGKTTLMGEASDILTAANIEHAAIELDTLALGHFPTGADELQSRNLAAVWANYARVGVSRLLLSGAIESPARLKQVQDSIPGARILVCRLRARLTTMQERVRLREPGMLQDEFVARVEVLETLLDAASLENFEIRNDQCSITEVARDLLDRGRWLPHEPT